MSYRDIDGNAVDGNGRAIPEPPEWPWKCQRCGKNLPAEYDSKVCMACEPAARIAALSAENARLRKALPADDDPLATADLVKCGTFTSEARKRAPMIQVEKALFDRLLEDKERLDWLEAVSVSEKVGNGVAIFPLNTLTGEQRFILQDLGDDDGSGMGDEMATSETTLRSAIDAARKEQKA